MKAPLPSIGKHLAVLNLFREADGSVRITVATATGALAERERHELTKDYDPPIKYVEALIVDAAQHFKGATFEQAWAKFEAAGYQYGGDALTNVRFGWKIANGLEPNQ